MRARRCIDIEVKRLKLNEILAVKTRLNVHERTQTKSYIDYEMRRIVIYKLEVIALLKRDFLSETKNKAESKI